MSGCRNRTADEKAHDTKSVSWLPASIVLPLLKQVARTAGFAVRVFSLAIIATVSYSTPVSKLRRPFLSDRFFFVAVRLLRRRQKLVEPDFVLLAPAFNRARVLHPFYLTAWVFLPDQRPQRNPPTGGYLCATAALARRCIP
jgi:hypothetical protein